MILFFHLPNRSKKLQILQKPTTCDGWIRSRFGGGPRERIFALVAGRTLPKPSWLPFSFAPSFFPPFAVLFIARVSNLKVTRRYSAENSEEPVWFLDVCNA